MIPNIASSPTNAISLVSPSRTSATPASFLTKVSVFKQAFITAHNRHEALSECSSIGVDMGGDAIPFLSGSGGGLCASIVCDDFGGKLGETMLLANGGQHGEDIVRWFGRRPGEGMFSSIKEFVDVSSVFLMGTMFGAIVSPMVFAIAGAIIGETIDIRNGIAAGFRSVCNLNNPKTEFEI